jgi:TAG lipase/steryl ester hydrolase/phospholipase A2/LPA acyltransferase
MAQQERRTMLPAHAPSTVVPFTYKHALRAALIRSLLRPVRWGAPSARACALSACAVLSGWLAARSRAARLAAEALCAVARSASPPRRRKSACWLGAAALLLLLCKPRSLLLLLLRSDVRARWRRRRELRARLASATCAHDYARARAELDALEAPPPRRPRQRWPAAVACEQPGAMSEFRLGAELLDAVSAGARANDDDLLHDLWTGLRAGLAAKASDAAATALQEQSSGRGVRALTPTSSPEAAAVKRIVSKLVYELPDLPGFGPRERAAMLDETLTVCGRHALLLSGGGVLGTVHVGVVSALLRAGCLPHVVAGSSAGAVVAAVVCTRNTAELEDFLRTFPTAGEPATELFVQFFGHVPVRQRMRNLMTSGFLYPSAGLRANLRRLLGDVTFRQAFEHSQRCANA